MVHNYEELDNLPLRQGKAKYCKDKYGYLPYHDHYWGRKSAASPWVILDRTFEEFIGKHVNDAYSKYCKKVPWNFKHVFWKRLNDMRTYRWTYYYVDDEGLIQCINTNKKEIYSISSPDYKVEFYNKITGFIIERYNLKRYTKNGNIYEAWGQTKKCKWSKHWYEIHETQIGRRPVSGWIRFFESKNDPRYKRYFAELKKATKSKFVNQKEEERKQREMDKLITECRRRAAKEREETRIKLEAKGFRPMAFTNRVFDSENYIT